MEPRKLSSVLNQHGQPVGEPLHNWQPVPQPHHTTITGEHVRLVPLQPEKHDGDLYEALCGVENEPLWTYLPHGPFASRNDFSAWLQTISAQPGTCFFVLENLLGQARGQFALTAIDTNNGCAELAHVVFGQELQRSTAATEATFLLLNHIFKQGYRRVSWKCNALNAPSQRAARRYGFAYEGLFRNALVVKGHNRDTAWFAITRERWPALARAYRQWLAPQNFESSGQQKVSLSELTRNLS